MTNSKISDLLEQLKNDNRSSDVDNLIRLLEAKQAELGDAATEEQVEQAIQDCLVPHLTGAFKQSDDGGVDKELKLFMENATAVAKSLFDEEKWHYTERISKQDLVVYELRFNLRGASSSGALRVRLNIDASSKVCRIEAVLPITADEKYSFLLCQAIAKCNYPKIFGALYYDESDGEVSYRYYYPISHGVYKDDLKRVFLAVVSSASASYDEVKKHCIGKYKQKEVNDIRKKVKDLVIDLGDDGE